QAARAQRVQQRTAGERLADAGVGPGDEKALHGAGNAAAARRSASDTASPVNPISPYAKPENGDSAASPASETIAIQAMASTPVAGIIQCAAIIPRNAIRSSRVSSSASRSRQACRYSATTTSPSVVQATA